MLLLPPPLLLLLLPLVLLRAQGWDPREPDMQRVVAIHNTVNERAWQHVMAWEALHACDCAEPRLKRFQGKPNEFSPKARLLNMLVRVIRAT
jgi:cytochrome c heme-lyase